MCPVRKGVLWASTAVHRNRLTQSALLRFTGGEIAAILALSDFAAAPVRAKIAPFRLKRRSTPTIAIRPALNAGLNAVAFRGSHPRRE
jgi:hypothetical protein